MTVFSIVLAFYFFITSGVLYDIRNEPPAVGVEKDQVSGGFRNLNRLVHDVRKHTNNSTIWIRLLKGDTASSDAGPQKQACKAQPQERTMEIALFFLLSGVSDG